jgi:hypothetical protein
LDIHQQQNAIAGASSGRFGAVEYLGEIAEKRPVDAARVIG